MIFQRRFTLLLLLAPVFLGILVLYYKQANRRTRLANWAQNGIVALYRDGIVNREDLRNYFQNPPIGDSSIMRALEITPEDVSGLEEEEPEWLKSQPGQLLFSRMIKHICLVKYLNSKAAKVDEEKILQDIKEYQESLMVELLEKDMVNIKPEIKQEEILAYYVDHPEEFHQTGKRYAQYIMLNSDTAGKNDQPAAEISADELMERLESGEDFNRLITEIQLEGSPNAGDLGWLPKGSLTKTVDQVIWSLGVGEVTGPIELRDSVHFFHLIDEQKEGLLSLEKSTEQIQKQIENIKRSLHRSQLLGLTPQIYADADAASSEAYRSALLQTAYSRGLDKNSEVLRKTRAFSEYRRADVQFENRREQLRRSKYASRSEESTWILENETAKILLQEMKFRMTVKLNLPISETQDES